MEVIIFYFFNKTLDKLIAICYHDNMSKRDKLIQRIMNGQNVSYEEAKKILLFFGYEVMNTCGSHVTFSKPERKSITLVSYQKELKPYLMKKLQEALENE